MSGFDRLALAIMIGSTVGVASGLANLPWAVAGLTAFILCGVLEWVVGRKK